MVANETGVAVDGGKKVVVGFHRGSWSRAWRRCPATRGYVSFSVRRWGESDGRWRLRTAPFSRRKPPPRRRDCRSAAFSLDNVFLRVSRPVFRRRAMEEE